MTAARATRPPAPVTLDEILSRDGDVTKHLGDRPLRWHVDPRESPPDVLALDLAALGGWFYLGARSRAAGVIIAEEARIDSAWTMALGSVLTMAANRAGLDGQRLLVVCEDTNLGSAARTPLAFAAVTRYGSAAATLCAERRLTLIRVVASEWQRRVLGKYPREQGKALSLARARREFGGAITTDDVADASLLALYVRGRAR